jgi:serine/threonine protein kinase
LTLRRFEDDYQVAMLSCARCDERRHAIVPLCVQVGELVGEGGYGVVRKCVRHGDVLRQCFAVKRMNARAEGGTSGLVTSMAALRCVCLSLHCCLWLHHRLCLCLCELLVLWMPRWLRRCVSGGRGCGCAGVWVCGCALRWASQCGDAAVCVAVRMPALLCCCGREMKLLRELRHHPNVVRLYEVYMSWHDRTMHLVFELGV